MVCLRDQVVIGQSVPGTEVDIPLLGDLSSRHATLIRGTEGYILQPHAHVRVAGRTVDGPTAIVDRDEIRLGDKVILQFRLPNPLTSTARLDFVSRHRTQPSVDAILLMGNACLLGPGDGMHVVCRHWKHELTLSRSDGGFRFRTHQRVELDGTSVAGVGKLHWNSHLAGDDFALTLEPL